MIVISLFMDMAGNTPFLRDFQKKSVYGMSPSPGSQRELENGLGQAEKPQCTSSERAASILPGLLATVKVSRARGDSHWRGPVFTQNKQGII